MTEPTETTRPGPIDGPAEPPAEATPSGSPRFFRTLLGAAVLGLGTVVAYFLIGQILPGIAIGVWLVVKAGGVLAPADMQQQIVGFVAPLTIVATGVAAVQVGLLKGLRWLPPGPTEAKRGRLAWFAAICLATLGGQQVLTYVLTLAGHEMVEQEVIVQAATTGAGGASALLFLAVAVAAPLGEELIFRRVLFGAFAHAHGRALAYVVSAVVFALIHMHLPALAHYLWMGACYAFAYERCGVAGSFGVHAVNNGLVFCFIGS